jgi:hypothetical protein
LLPPQECNHMPDKSALDKLMDRTPLAIVVIGVIVFIIGAAGGLPIGTPPLQVSDLAWRIGLAAMGLILCISGLFFITAENRHTKQSSNTISQLKSDKEALSYMLNRMRQAKKSISDLTLEEPLGTGTAYALDADDRDEYYSVVEETSKRVLYREIIMFRGSEKRISKAKRLINSANKYYQLAGYADLPNGAPPIWNFVIIDDEEVIVRGIAIKQPDIVDHFRRYYDELWGKAIPMRIGDAENLALLTKAGERQSS